MGSLFTKPGIKEKIIWYIDAALARAQVLACIEEDLEATLMNVSDVRDRHVVEQNTVPQLGGSGLPATT
jgi:hypothetical protein